MAKKSEGISKKQLAAAAIVAGAVIGTAYAWHKMSKKDKEKIKKIAKREVDSAVRTVSKTAHEINKARESYMNSPKKSGNRSGPQNSSMRSASSRMNSRKR